MLQVTTQRAIHRGKEGTSTISIIVYWIGNEHDSQSTVWSQCRRLENWNIEVIGGWVRIRVHAGQILKMN